METSRADAKTEQFTVLTRDMPWKNQVRSAGLIGAVPLVVGAGILFMTIANLDSEPLTEAWLPVFVGSAFTLVGLLMTWTAIHQFFASGTAEAEVAVASLPLRPGGTARLRIHQPGPVELQSLSARLVCEVKTRHESDTRGGHYYYTSSFPWQEKFAVSGPALIAPGSTFEATAQFTVPTEAEPSQDRAERSVEWRVELWGCVAAGPDFMHPYTIRVRR